MYVYVYLSYTIYLLIVQFQCDKYPPIFHITLTKSPHPIFSEQIPNPTEHHDPTIIAITLLRVILTDIDLHLKSSSIHVPIICIEIVDNIGYSPKFHIIINITPHTIIDTDLTATDIHHQKQPMINFMYHYKYPLSIGYLHSLLRQHNLVLGQNPSDLGMITLLEDGLRLEGIQDLWDALRGGLVLVVCFLVGLEEEGCVGCY